MTLRGGHGADFYERQTTNISKANMTIFYALNEFLDIRVLDYLSFLVYLFVI